MRIEVEQPVIEVEKEIVRKFRLMQSEDEVCVETTDDNGNEWILLGFRVVDGKVVFFRAECVGDDAINTDRNEAINEVAE